MSDVELTLSLESTDFPCDRLRVKRVTGKEAISRLYEYLIEVVSLDQDGPNPADMIGGEVTLVINGHAPNGGGFHGERRLHGTTADVTDLLSAHDDLRVFRLRVVPRAFALTLVETQEIFMGLAIPDVVKAKFEAVELGAAFETRLSGDYPAREFVVQYQETDLAFVSRLAEHLGISFFFDQRDDGETVVFTDQSNGFARIDEGVKVHFRPRGEKVDVFELEAKYQVVPAYYAVRDYNYRTPQLDLTAEKTIDGAAGGVIEFGAHHKTPAEGATIVRARAEERQAAQLVYSGKSVVPALGAGIRFTMEAHPILGNVELLVTELEFEAHQIVAGSGRSDAPPYVNRFSAIPADRTFRPARVTRKPRIAGLVTGIIDAGPEDSDTRYARLDDQGRYMVRFLFDTMPPGEGGASRPVRMVQNHAGENYGTHFPLKPGVEVVLAFIDGDPDRPLIVGAVPNPIRPSPVTRDNPGTHRIKTASGITLDMVE